MIHVQVFSFGPDGAFVERVDAESATLEDGYWRLTDAKVVTPGFDTLSTGVYLLATTLTRSDIAQAFDRARNRVILGAAGTGRTDAPRGPRPGGI